MVSSSGTWITVATETGDQLTCLRTRGLPPVRPGDRVLLQVIPGGHAVLAVLDDGSPDELVIEAGRQLTLRCGQGSITIRHDGRVLIQGFDIVSRAGRANRIKGGQVVIN